MRRNPPVHLASLGLLLLLAYLPPVQADGDPGQTEFSWRAPADITGPGAFRVTVDVGQDNHCRLFAEGTGAGDGGPNLWVRIDNISSMHAGSPIAQVHAAGVIDTRSILTSSHRSGSRAIIEDVHQGVHELTVVATDLDAWLINDPDPWWPVRFEVTCMSPFQLLAFSGSREIVAFSEQTLNGVAVAENLPFVPAAQANVLDQIAAEMTTARVEATLWHGVHGGASAYDWSLETPHQLYSPLGTNLGGWEETYVSGGPGRYAFTLTHAFAGQSGVFYGWFVGFAEVPDLGSI